MVENIGLYVEPVKRDSWNDKSMVWYLSLVSVEGDVIRNVTWDSWNPSEYADMVFAAYISWDNGATRTAFHEIKYRSVHSVDLKRCDVMTKALKRAQRVCAKLPVDGLTFAQWAVLVADGLGIKYAVQLQGKNHGWHSENEYRVEPIREAQGMIERALDVLKAEVLPAEEVSSVV